MFIPQKHANLLMGCIVVLSVTPLLAAPNGTSQKHVYRQRYGQNLHYNKVIWTARWVIVEIIVPRCYGNCYNSKHLCRSVIVLSVTPLSAAPNGTSQNHVCRQRYGGVLIQGGPEKNGIAYFPQYVDAMSDISVWGNFSLEK